MKIISKILKQLILYLFLILIFKTSTIVYGQGGFCNEQSDVLNIDLLNDSIELINSIPLKLTNYKGFPVLDCSFRDGGCEFPTNRYLVKSNEGSYFVIDSNYRIKIDASDSIIAFSHEVYSEDNLIDVACSPDYRGRKKIYYQAIRDGLTNLYDYQGNSIISSVYLGEIFTDSYHFQVNKSYWVTVNHYCDVTTMMGLIDSTGRTILSQVLITQRFISQFDPNFDYIWQLRDSESWETRLYNAKSGEVILTYDGLNSYKFDFAVFIYKWKNKYGLYHPIKGIIFPPKYDNITVIENTNDSFLLKKGKKEIKWIVPQEIKEHKLTY